MACGLGSLGSYLSTRMGLLEFFSFMTFLRASTLGTDLALAMAASMMPGL